MTTKTKVELSDVVWNPITGCNPVSIGCSNCYVEHLSRDYQKKGYPRYVNGVVLTLHEDILDQPLRWPVPRRICVCSMSDLFHEGVPVEFIQKAFAIMSEAYWHTFQILTKRSRRMLELSNRLPWPENIWMGVTAEDEQNMNRIDDLRIMPAKLKFLALEPLLSRLPNLNLDGINGVIVGGDYGGKPKPMRKEWVIEIRDKCLAANVPFFFKQWSAAYREEPGHLLDGREWKEMPRMTHEDPQSRRISE